MRTISIEPGKKNPEDAIHILMADDDRNEHLLMAMAAEESKRPVHVEFVDDGAHLMMELAACEHLAELPDVIILDLRMPRLDGKRTLAELQSHPTVWRIPVVVFTTSSRVEDESSCYELGAFHFETKPGTFEGMVDFFDRLTDIASTRSIRAIEADGITDVISLVQADLLADLEDKATTDLVTD